MTDTISEIAGLALDPETHRMLSSANLKTFNAVFQTTDLELYRLFNDDISRVKEVREAVAKEMKRLGHWKPRPGETTTWLPVQLLFERTAEYRARVAEEQARLAEERRERNIAEHIEYQKLMAARELVAAAELAELKRLGFSGRVRNCLHKDGLLTIEAIARASDRQLLMIPGFGRKALREVREIVLAAQARAATKPRVRIRAWMAPYQSPMSDERHAS